MKRLVLTLILVPVSFIALLPLLSMIVLSFCDGRFPSFPWPGWSLRWYHELLGDGKLLTSLTRSALVASAVAIISSVMGYGSGYWLARLPRPVGEKLMLIFTLPALIPFILFGYCFSDFARHLEIIRTVGAVIIAHIVVFSPLSLALCYRRIRQLNSDVEDAARELGASESRIFLQVTGGQIWRTILASQIIVFVLSWDEYIISWFVSGFDKTYPVQVRTMLESTMSPEINAVGSVIALTSCVLMGLALFLLKRQ